MRPDAAAARPVDVTVWWHDANRGNLPPVCVGTGVAADKYQHFYELAPPLLTWFAIVLLPCWLVAGFFLLADAGVRLPVSKAWSGQLRNRTAQALVLIPIAALLVWAASALRDLDLVLGALAAMSCVASLALSFRRQAMQPRYSRRHREAKQAPEYVVLGNVHPDFAAAVARRYQENAG
jgi:hypothetical protein